MRCSPYTLFAIVSIASMSVCCCGFMIATGFDFFASDIHIHVPAGATLVTALTSLVTGKAVDPTVGLVAGGGRGGRCRLEKTNTRR
ncbi:MAG: hypothetical protein GX837_11875 [Methanomicrobiales archaeon]|nr:hypothetical protein [Methanomicrobiales archaeon]